MARVLVTGAGGFVGVPTVAALVHRGEEVHALSTRQAPPPLPGVQWHRADLGDAEAVERLLSDLRPERLVHLAWYVEHGLFWEAPENEMWVERSMGLLRAFTAAGGRRAVLLGTCAEYDWACAGEPLHETRSPLAPSTLYGTAKDALRRAAGAYAQDEGVELAWGRLFFLYGPREAPGRLVSSVIRALLAGDHVPTTSGVQRRDFMHVEDVGRALAALLASSAEGPVNIASGRDVAVSEILDLIAAAVGRPELVQQGALPDREGEPPLLVADVARLREEVGFRARPRSECRHPRQRRVVEERGRPRRDRGREIDVAREDTLLVHLVWAPLGAEPLARFIDSYRRHDAGAEHRLLVLLNGFAPDQDLAPWRELLREVEHEELRLPRPVIDLAAYREAAARTRARSVCFLNSHSVVLADGWLAALAGALEDPRVGIAGATGSWGSIRSYQRFMLGLGGPYARVFPDRRRTNAILAAVAAGQPSAQPQEGRRPFLFLRTLIEQSHGFAALPAAHVRTNAFMLSSELFADLRAPELRRKSDAYRFESGRASITAQIRARGLRAVLVGRDGRTFDPEDWAGSETFWHAAQENLLVSDNQTRAYEQADADTRATLAAFAWGSSGADMAAS